MVGCPKWDAQLAGQKVFKLVKWPNEFHDDPMILANALRVSLQAGPHLLRRLGFGCGVVGRISLKLTERSKVSFRSVNKQVFCWAAFLDISHNLHLYSRGYSRIILYVGLCRGWSKHNICNIQYVYIYIYIYILCVYIYTHIRTV